MKHNPDNPLWPAWKVTLLSLAFSFGVLMATAGIMGAFGDNPERAGEQAGSNFGWVILVVPLTAYVVQKFRIDNWNRRNPPRGPQYDSRSI